MMATRLVVIARFLPEIHAIEKLLEKKGLRYSVIHGGVTDRPAQIEVFQNDPAVRVFVGQIATAGLGITLTAASTMIFYSLDYSMSNYEQTRARIHRVGQKHPCTYIHLVAKGTVDEKVLKACRTRPIWPRRWWTTIGRAEIPLEDEMEGNQIFELADELKALRERKAELETELKQINRKIYFVDADLSDLMGTTGTQNFTRDGTMFFLTAKVHASAKAGMKEALFDVLRANGYGDLITETINAGSLSSFVKEQITENEDVLPGWLDGLVNVFEKTTVGVRKAAR
mgnify:CR=1 FL=1